MDKKILLEKYIKKLKYHYNEGFNKKLKENIFDKEMYDDLLETIYNIYLYYKGKKDFPKKLYNYMYIINNNLNILTDKLNGKNKHIYTKYDEYYDTLKVFINNMLADSLEDNYYFFNENKKGKILINT